MRLEGLSLMLRDCMAVAVKVFSAFLRKSLINKWVIPLAQLNHPVATYEVNITLILVQSLKGKDLKLERTLGFLIGCFICCFVELQETVTHC